MISPNLNPHHKDHARSSIFIANRAALNSELEIRAAGTLDGDFFQSTRNSVTFPVGVEVAFSVASRLAESAVLTE